jgi:hypothetical protein
MVAAISGEYARRMVKLLGMRVQGGGNFTKLRGMIEDIPTGDDTPFHFTQHHMLPKLNVCAPAFKRGMIRVCGSNRLSSFSRAGTG